MMNMLYYKCRSCETTSYFFKNGSKEKSVFKPLKCEILKVILCLLSNKQLTNNYPLLKIDASDVLLDKRKVFLNR